MKKRGKSKVTVAELLITPSPRSSPPDNSPKTAIFTRTASTSKNVKRATAGTKSQPLKALSNISELKDLASSRVDELKRQIDRSHSEILKDLEASQSRLHKRFKMQSQTCQQIMDEADKEHKKVSERITESREAMKASYEEFIADAQASASRACKTSIADLSQSFDKSIVSLRNRFGISST
ncbi:kinesin-like protein [Senna tora]|uniref:Kinesin-like protein n=1 Tax=Senna tora TaxID=362788 RepID=A0A834SS86_9FABA|nr:kinesin-like protein [Senna tora]